MSANRLELNTDKTELLRAGLKHSVLQFQGHGPAIQLGADTVWPSDQVWLLGVIISADLSLDRHTSAVSVTSFHWLRQLRRVHRSLDIESAATIVHASVTSRVDYFNLLLARCNKAIIHELQRVMYAAARVVSGTRKYERGLRQLRHAELHWLDVADRVTFKLCMTVHKCLHSYAPDYLSVLCTPVAQVTERVQSQSWAQTLFYHHRQRVDAFLRRSKRCVRPAAAYSSCQKFSSIRTAVVRSPWLVRPSGREQATGHCLWPMTHVTHNKVDPWPIVHDSWPIGVKTTKLILVAIFLLQRLLTQYLTHRMMSKFKCRQFRILFLYPFNLFSPPKLPIYSVSVGARR